jgi:hypothetical protein
MKKIIFFLLILPLLMAGGVYKWTDENGNVHFGDRPSNSKNAESIEVKTQKAGMPAPQSKSNHYQKAEQKQVDSDLKKAENNYKEVLSGFYETESPSSSCRYAVNLQDEMKFLGSTAYALGDPMPKRKIYLCPKE